MLEVVLKDFNDLEGDCKDLIVDAYINHKEELIVLPRFPTKCIVIGYNWSYSARNNLGRSDLSPTNPITKELRKKKIDSMQYIRHLPDEKKNFGDFEQIVLGHMGIPRRIKSHQDSYLDFGEFLALFLIGENRLKEAEAYQRQWHSSRNNAGHTVMPNRILFLYDAKLNDRGVITLY